MNMLHHHTIRADELVQSHHARGACEVSLFPDSARNAFGFRSGFGANSKIAISAIFEFAPVPGLEPGTFSLQLSQNYFWGWTISLPYLL